MIFSFCKPSPTAALPPVCAVTSSVAPNNHFSSTHNDPASGGSIKC